MDLSVNFFLAVVVILFTVGFNFVNGFHDAANVVATMISTRAFQPETALIIAATAEFIGPFIFGTAVAKTIGKDIISPEAITVTVILASLIGAIAWNLLTWYFGLPSSSSHALVGGLGGAVLAGYGWHHLYLKGFLAIILVLITSPIIGLIAGYIFQKILIFFSRGFSPKLNETYKKLQIVSALGLALSHGANDTHKSTGIITMTLVSLGILDSFHVPIWVILVCAPAMGLGTAFGGWKIIKTVGNKIYKLRPIHGFAAQAASGSVVLAAGLLGGPVSTTHVMASSIAGVGSAERFKAVRWNTAYDIVIAWFITIPAAALMSALMYYLFSMISHFAKGA